MYKQCIKDLKMAGININDEFFSYDISGVALLQGMQMLLKSISNQGLNLTPEGYIPKKLSKQIVEVASTKYDKKYHYLQQKRYHKKHHANVFLIQIVSEILAVTKEEDRKLFLTQKGKEYLFMNNHQQHITLLHIMLSMKSHLLDKYQEANCVTKSAIMMLHIVRNMKKEFRTVRAYVDFLLECYPVLKDDINMLETSTCSSRNHLEEFTLIIGVRYFKRLFLPLGLVEIQTDEFRDDDLFIKSPLLEKLLPSLFP